jgi:hypothetical protein
VLLGILAPFVDRIGHLAGLAESNPDPAPFVTHHHERAKAEAPPAFDDLGGSIDENYFLAQFASLFAFASLIALAGGATPAWSATGTARPASGLVSSLLLISHVFSCSI